MNLHIKIKKIITVVFLISAFSRHSYAAINLNIPANANVDLTSSHTLQVTDIHINRQGIRTINDGTFIHAVSYADFDQDGDTDIFMSSGDATVNQTASEFYLNDGSNNFSLDTSFFNGTPPKQVHPRKALTGDFNGDGKMDVFVIGQGYDQPPFPGEAPYVILSSQNGFFLGTGLDTLSGFFHAGTSADIDADGDLDIFITNYTNSFFLINNGNASFTKDTSRLSGLNNPSFYTAELVDVDKDGFVDLLVAGHEQDGAATKILWGDSTGFYSASKATTLPPIPGNGIVIDIDLADLDSDGDKDIVLNRTGDSTGSLAYYQGYYVQLIEQTSNRQFNDVTINKLSNNSLSPDPIFGGGSQAYSWFDWIRLQDFNEDGHVDIVVDDAARTLIWLNDGSGNFSPLQDYDKDGIENLWEFDNGLNPSDASDANQDFDFDGLSNLNEFILNTDPLLPDTDSDNHDDSVDNCPTVFDFDQTDTDNNGQGNACDSDDDGDGLSDEDEINIHSTNPLLADSDGDGLSDYNELNTYGTDPLQSDSDNDGHTDKEEVDAGTNPKDKNDSPNQGKALIGIILPLLLDF